MAPQNRDYPECVETRTVQPRGSSVGSTIPVDIVRKLGIREGDQVTWVLDGDRVELIPPKRQ